MLKVLLYGYATGVRSSRKLKDRLAADINFMFVAGQARPNHKTIAEFRRRHLASFAGLFLTALRLRQAAGLAKLGRVAIDGTKLKANASRHKAMSYGRMTEREAQLEAEVSAILADAEAVDQAEDARYCDARGDELPPEMRRRARDGSKSGERGWSSLECLDLGREVVPPGARLWDRVRDGGPASAWRRAPAMCRAGRRSASVEPRPVPAARSAPVAIGGKESNIAVSCHRVPSTRHTWLGR